MHTYLLKYQFNGEPREHSLELKQPRLADHEAAMHLLELHYGDAENSLLMPTADSTPPEILAQAENRGITQIRVEG
ncbi:hypothetical protein PHLH6_25820 [Pseudomonas sp. Seg1]|uniref:hypothetical protein n=1 Tax=unclassified Pseudomonas TaxID=196821 RepID=UPI000CD223AA|nr:MULTISPECIES: hypothetical protein [unclassified Pseudomonas]POA41613.1 hypothetical protein C1893_30910 [Pseudomonas sp. MPR-ANC1]BBP70578.1 hypothetical protein PHLH6_25820 [Pseudomonas sp. Seg1]